MKSKCIKHISSVPFVGILTSNKYPDKVVLEYAKLYRKELTIDDVVDYISHTDNNGTYRHTDNIGSIDKKMEYLLELYELDNLNLEVTKEKMMDLYSFYKSNRIFYKGGFHDFIKVLTNEKGYKYDLSPDDISRMYSIFNHY